MLASASAASKALTHAEIFGLCSRPRGDAAHKGWDKQWTFPEPKSSYDVIIVGAGGHGLATAYYLAKEHGITNVAVLEKGWLGGGNTGRNTTIIRSNYLYDEIRRHLRPCGEAVGRASPGSQLQCDVFGARRDDAGAQCA